MIYIHVCYQNSFIRRRPFFENKSVTFAKLSRTPRFSIAEPMLGNSASYEKSFITCQTTPENYGSLLDSLINMQPASRDPFSGQIVADQIFCKVFWPPPSKCTLTCARSFEELSRNFRENIPITIDRPKPSAHQRKGKYQGPWCLALAKPRFWKLGGCA